MICLNSPDLSGFNSGPVHLKIQPLKVYTLSGFLFGGHKSVHIKIYGF